MAIIKNTSWDPYNADGDPVLEIAKTANMGVYHSEYMPEIGEFLASLAPKKGHLYVLCNALGGSEAWGANRNSDLFPGKPYWGLDHTGPVWGYETFKHHAHVFRHHRNQLAMGHPSYGRIVFAVWNKPMWRVETLAEVRRGNPDVEDIVSDLDAGRPAAVSMGCRIPFDECTICGNRAQTSKTHCEHLKNQMGQMMPDGTKVGMINYYPQFFDQSSVRVGADPSAWAHTKVADGGPADHKPLHQPVSYTSPRFYGKVASFKEGEHIKEMPAEGTPAPQVMGYLHGQLRPREKAMSRPVQQKMAHFFPLGDILSTMHFAGMEILPEEFQYMALINEYPKVAEKLAEEGVVFQVPDNMAPTIRTNVTGLDLAPVRVQPLIFDALVGDGLLEKRSAWRPFLFCRTVDYLKQAAGQVTTQDYVPPPMPAEDETSAIPLLAAFAGLFLVARNKLKGMPMGSVADPAHGRAAQIQQTISQGVDQLRKSRIDDIADSMKVPGLAYVLAQGGVDAQQAVTAPYGPGGEIYWQSPVLPALEQKEAGAKRNILLGAIGVPTGYGVAGYYEAEKNTYGKLPFRKKVVNENPFAAGVAGAAAVGVGTGAYSRWRNSPKTTPTADVAEKGKSLFDKGKSVLKNVVKRADLLEQIALDPEMWIIDPEAQDELLADAVIEG